MHADFGEHSINHIAIRTKPVQKRAQVWVGKTMNVLLLDDNLWGIANLCSRDAGKYGSPIQQRSGGLLLSYRTHDAVRFPAFEFRIVLRMGIGGRDDLDAMVRGKTR